MWGVEHDGKGEVGGGEMWGGGVRGRGGGNAKALES